jgi:hypothetical protein
MDSTKPQPEAFEASDDINFELWYLVSGWLSEREVHNVRSFCAVASTLMHVSASYWRSFIPVKDPDDYLTVTMTEAKFLEIALAMWRVTATTHKVEEA